MLLLHLKQQTRLHSLFKKFVNIILAVLLFNMFMDRLYNVQCISNFHIKVTLSRLHTFHRGTQDFLPSSGALMAVT